jgi:hypothetical protein
MTYNLTVVSPGGGSNLYRISVDTTVNQVLDNLRSSFGQNYKIIGYENKQVAHSDMSLFNAAGTVGGIDMLRAVPETWQPLASGSSSRSRSPPRMPAPTRMPTDHATALRAASERIPLPAVTAQSPTRSLQSQFATLRSRYEELRRQQDAILEQMENLVLGR